MARKDLENTINELGDKIAHRVTLEDDERTAEIFGDDVSLALEMVHDV